MPPGALNAWVYASRKGNWVCLGKDQKPLTELEWNWRELAEVRMSLPEAHKKERRPALARSREVRSRGKNGNYNTLGDSTVT